MSISIGSAELTSVKTHAQAVRVAAVGMPADLHYHTPSTVLGRLRLIDHHDVEDGELRTGHRVVHVANSRNLMAVNMAVTRQRSCHEVDATGVRLELDDLVPRAGFEPATP